MALLRGAARFGKAAIEFRGPRLGHRRHARPRRARLGETVDEVLAREAFDGDAHRNAVGLFLLKGAALTVRLDPSGLISRQALAHRIGGGFEVSLDAVLDVGVGQQFHPRHATGGVRLAQLRKVGDRRQRGHLRDEIARRLLVGVLERGSRFGHRRGRRLAGLQQGARLLLRRLGARLLADVGQRLG